jgi:hypothetical protein
MNGKFKTLEFCSEMMPIVTIRDSTVCDVYALASNLRPADRAEVEALGISPRDGIRRSYRHAILRRTYLIHGEIAAMSGLGGAMLSDEGNPWLMTTPLVETVPVAFVKIARNQLDDMLVQRKFLWNYVQFSYERARRLLEVLGFVLDPPIRLGPDQTLFQRFWIERS